MTRIFRPILKHFEKGGPVSNYKKSHRAVLVVVGGLFLFLSLVSALAAMHASQFGALIPVIIFFAVGLVALIVGALGSDDAVSRLWRNR